MTPVMQSSINDARKEPKGSAELLVSWLLSGEEEQSEFRVSICIEAIPLRLEAMSAAYCSVRVKAGCGRPSAVQTRGPQ